MFSRAVIAISIVSALVLLGSMVGLVRTSAGRDAASLWVTRTYEAIEELSSIESGIAIAEASLRAFAITGEKSSLLETEKGIARAEHGYTGALRRTADNADAQAKLLALRPLLSKRVAQLWDGQRLAQEGRPLELIVSPARIQLGQELRGVVGRLIEDEHRLLADRVADSARQTLWAQRAAFFGGALSLALYGVVFAMLWRQTSRLREAEEQLRLTLDHAPIGMSVVSLDGRFERVNDALCRMLGRTRSALIGAVHTEVVHPEDLALDAARTEQLLRGEVTSFALDQRCLHRDGSVIYAQLTASLVRSGSGVPRFVVRQLHDVTQRRTAEAEARTFFDESVDLLAILGPSGTFERVNTAWTRVLGWSPLELTTRPYLDLVHPDDVELTLRSVADAQGGRPPVALRNRYRTRDGRYRWLEWSARPSSAGRMFCIARDVTERLRAEEQSRLLAELTQLMVEAPDVDTAFARALASLCVSQDWDYGELWLPGDEADTLTCHPAAYARDPERMAAFRAISRDGVCRPGVTLPGRVFARGEPERHADLRLEEDATFARRGAAIEAGLVGCLGVPLRGQRGVEGVLLLLRDAALRESARELALLLAVGGQLGMLVERKRTEDARRVSEERLQLASQATSDVLYDWNVEHDELWLGDALQRAFGYDVHRVGRDWWLARVHPDEVDAVRASLAQAVRGEQSHWSSEYRFRRADGDYAHVFDRGVVMRGQDGHVARLIGSMMDISERVRAAAALREAKESAEAAGRAKSTFLAHMSHEIRTPLTALLGFADLLLDPKLGESDRVNFALTIRRNGEHLLSLLNDILDVSKIEAGKLALEQIVFSPPRVLTELASLMRVRALEKGLDFNLVYETPVPAEVRGDPTRMRQIVLNLVSNAVKFTEQGAIALSARCDAHEDGFCFAISVRDTGIGMDAAQVQRIFQPFAQGDASMTRRFGGTGLGLAICAPLAKALGGALEVQTEPGRGSTFTLNVPVGAVPGATMLANPSEALFELEVRDTEPLPRAREGDAVLLAEDGHDNQILISTLLRRQGYQVTVVENGVLAVERALAAARDAKPFGVILMDMQMPELDGYGAASKLRASGYRGFVIALTAHAMAGERERCLSAGCDAYLTKPIDRVELLGTVAAYFARVEALGEAPGEAMPRRITGKLSTPELLARLRASSPENDPNAPLRSELAGDPEIGGLIAGFVAGLGAQATALREASVRGDRPTLARLAHQLKGAGGGYGFPSITQAAAALEQRAKEPDVALDDALSALLALCARAREAPVAELQTSEVVARGVPIVLVIDDSLDAQSLVAARLSSETLRIVTATSAREGLARAREETPDLVLLDLDLPDATGFDVCRELKGDARTASVPVLFLTGTEDSSVKAAAFELGATDYVTKPFDATELRARVRAALRTKHYQDLLATRARVDGLTGLWNRAFFDVRLREELSAAKRHGQPLAIAMIDVDHFKNVNDSYGHPFGDQLLQAVGAGLGKLLRASDVACRYGGEEFVVILRNTGARAAVEVAERVRAMVSSLALTSRGKPVRATASVGVAASGEAAAHDRDWTPEALVEAADAALYRAKRGGRDRVELGARGESLVPSRERTG